MKCDSLMCERTEVIGEVGGCIEPEFFLQSVACGFHATDLTESQGGNFFGGKA